MHWDFEATILVLMKICRLVCEKIMKKMLHDPKLQFYNLWSSNKYYVDTGNGLFSSACFT